MKKYVIFDMDGVLINTEPLHYESWKTLFAERGLAIDFETYRPCIGSTLAALLDLVEKCYGRRFHEDPSVLPRFHELNELYIKEHGLPPVKGAAEAVRALKKAGFTLAVASSSPQFVIEKNIAALSLSDEFTVLCSGESVPRPKPFPDVFLKAAASLGAKSEECVVVEDSQNGSRAAKAADMACIGFANPDSGGQDLSAADRIISSMSDLLGAVTSL